MQHWLMKSEPDVFGLADLRSKPGGTAPWDGVRNYQARNFMRAMKVGDRVLIHHSSCAEPGIAGVAEVAGAARPDPTQFDPKSDYYDPAAKKAEPRWSLVDVRFVAEFPRFVPLAAMRADAALTGFRLLARGNRLSVLPVSPTHYRHICRLGGMK